MQETRFIDQYRLLGIEAPGANMDRYEKADLIFRAACKVQQIDPATLPLIYRLGHSEALVTSFAAQALQSSIIAFYKLQVIHNAIVGAWVAAWNNPRERKWSPFHWMNDPGFRFDGSNYDITGAAGGSRLCFETEEQSDFAGIECIALYADLNGAELAPAQAA
ncbi:MAG TPA: hypothetical protein VFE32_17190 [Puia sp.]|jgi:hypothetical protein|nr:hypothetical protein [Puia sp.]